MSPPAVRLTPARADGKLKALNKAALHNAIRRAHTAAPAFTPSLKASGCMLYSCNKVFRLFDLSTWRAICLYGYS